MAKMQSVVGYFESSTQAMTKLLDFQRTSHLSIYKNQRPKKPLQDVVTRWWSTYRSITRLRFLKKAITSLLVVGEIECEHISKEEWLVLDQLQILLETMAHFQRILEGESYVTGSLVPVAVFQIRQGYVEVIECDDTDPSVKSLAKVLLTDFDNRYAPACSDSGKVKYHREDTIGKYNRYIGIHQYFFVASFLDPRVAPLLSDMMTPDDYNMLKSDVIDFMVAKLKARSDNLFNENAPKQKSAPATQPPQNNSKRSQLKDKMFRGLNTKSLDAATATGNDPNDNDTALRAVCESELDRYLHDAINKGACAMYDENDAFNDPLKWWKENGAKYPYVANIARKYLAIPATSAPSERVWSRLARILSLRRACLSDDLVGRMMYVKENLLFLRKHYCSLRKKEMSKDLHHLVDLEFNYLIATDECDEDIDVGENDHLLDF